MKKNILAFCLSLVAFVASFKLCAQGLTRRTLPRRNMPAAPRATQAPAAATADASSDSDDPKEAPALNWDAAPVDIVFQTYGEQVNKTILKDPAVPNATITLKSREGQKLSKEEYLEAIEVVLEMNGIHLEPYGEKFMRAVPRGKVRKEGVPLYMDIMDVPEEAKDGKVISVMLSFKSIAIDEAQKALEGFKSDTAAINVFERTNAILVTDTWQNIKRMDEIAKAIDISSPVLEQVFVYQVENAAANDIKTALEQIVQESQKEQEKNGGGVQNNNSGMVRPSSLGSTRLLRNRNNQQPEPPKPAEAVVTTMSDADRGMIRGKVLILADERSNKLVIITSKSNYDFFEKIIKQLDVETTPDTVVKVYRLKYAEAEEVSDMINDLIGNAPSAKNSTKGNQNQAARGQGGTTRVSSPTAANAQRKSANQRTGEAKAGELSKENTTVLADKRINGLVVMTNKELVPVIESIIEAMDVKLSQVLIETVIIEVTLGDDLQTGIDWVQRGRARTSSQVQRQNAMGQPLYYMTRTASRAASGDTSAYSSTSLTGDIVPAGYSRSYTEGGITYTDTASTYGVFDTVSSLVRDGFANNGSYGLGGGGGGNSSLLKSLVNTAVSAGTNYVKGAFFGNVTPIGGGINYLLKSDRLNLAAVISASKSDSRAKYIASPIVMTVDNKEAVIEATQARKFLSNYQTNNGYSNGSGGRPAPQYENRDLGIKIKVTPKINPNGTVMLEIEEEYSQLGEQQAILDPDSNPVQVDTSVSRKMSADILLENMQTVVLGGLTETYTSEAETGIPVLKDIPWIGKWLFGTVSQSETRKELLVFMTPYVLDEGDAAQAEALRRKKSLSDTRPWDDHGWSASPLADPVSKKEQMRRLKDEWKKQDEERKTKLAIEEEKVKRAKALEGMTKAEQEHWLEMHKDELEKEDRDDEVEALEAKMKSKDDDTQEELRKLAAQIRAKKLKAAQEEIDAADKAAKSDNEYQKLKEAEAAKADKAAKPEVEKPAEPVAVGEEPAEPVAVGEEPAEPVAVGEEPAEPVAVGEAPAKPEPAKQEKESK